MRQRCASILLKLSSAADRVGVEHSFFLDFDLETTPSELKLARVEALKRVCYSSPSCMMPNLSKIPAPTDSSHAGVPAAEGVGPLQQSVEHQLLLLTRWLKVAHDLNNLFLVLNCEFEDRANAELNQMIHKSAAELRCVANDSRARLAESRLGWNHAESPIAP